MAQRKAPASGRRKCFRFAGRSSNRKNSKRTTAPIKAQSRIEKSSASIALSRIIFTGGIDGGIHQQMRAATFVAAFSQLLSNAAVAEGITSITTVHESFGHLPSSASRFRRSLRLSTVRAAFLNPFYFRHRLRVCWDAGQNTADATFAPLSVERGGAGGRGGRGGGGWGSDVVTRDCVTM
jgi:hypothetical protein